MSLVSYNVMFGDIFYFNLAYSFRIHKQIKYIKELNPDIICLQEMYDQTVRSKYKQKFRDYSYCIGQDYKFLNSMLYIMLFLLLLFVPVSIFYKILLMILSRHIFISTIIQRNSGLVIFLKKDRYVVKNLQFVQFKSKQLDWRRHFIKRGMLIIDAFDIDRQIELRIINTHMDAYGNKECIKELSGYITTNTVIAGDFNQYMTDDKIGKTYKKDYYGASYESWGTLTMRLLHDEQAGDIKQIDYIYSTDKNDSEIIIHRLNNLSDHHILECHNAY